MKVNERTTNLENDMTQLQERLPEEEMTAMDPDQVSVTAFIQDEKIKDLFGPRSIMTVRRSVDEPEPSLSLLEKVTRLKWRLTRGKSTLRILQEFVILLLRIVFILLLFPFTKIIPNGNPVVGFEEIIHQPMTWSKFEAPTTGFQETFTTADRLPVLAQEVEPSSLNKIIPNGNTVVGFEEKIHQPMTWSKFEAPTTGFRETFTTADRLPVLDQDVGSSFFSLPKFSQLNDSMKYGMELKSPRQILTYNWFEENERLTRRERSGVQKVIHVWKTVDCSGRKHHLTMTRWSIEPETPRLLEEEVTQLQERVLAEERTATEVKPSSPKSYTNALYQVRSAIDDNLDNISEHSLKVNQLDSVQRKQNIKHLNKRRNSRLAREKRSALTTKFQRRHLRENMGTPVEKMQKEESGYTFDLTTDNESGSGYETARVIGCVGTLSLGSALKIQHDKLGFTTDSSADKEDAQSSLSDNTGATATVKGDSDEEECLDGQSKLETCARVSVEGANLQIAETGVSLFIPPGALLEEQTIHVKIIPQPCDAKAALKFECNSVVVVELLPNNCRFQCPVSLTLPHCLQLKEEYERNSVDVLISHHDKGFKPNWEILHDVKFNLRTENCTISLHSFCWVTYEIHDTIVAAKRIKLYTAGKKMRLNDRIAEVEVGFYPDLPGSGKILELNKDVHLSQRKPYVFLKTGEEPLLISLHKVVPKQWNNSQPDENPKIIPFDSVSISEERSCPFVLERSGDDTDIPLCIFKVGQKERNEVELTIRPDVLTS